MRSPLILWSIARVPSSRALPSFPITAPPPVCVPDVIGASAVRIQNGKKITYRQTAATSAVCLFFYFGVVSTQIGVPSAADTHTGRGAVLGKLEGSPAPRHSRKIDLEETFTYADIQTKGIGQSTHP